MMARSGIRSSALSRAEAQLAGKRVPVKPKDSSDELQEYMRALSRKTSALKRSQPSIASLSDLSASEQESEKHKGTVSPQQSTGTQSRFLKKKSSAINNTESNVYPASVVAKPRPVQSKMPTSAALKRLAEFENRHRLRKLELDISENDSDLRTSEERPFSNRSSSEFSSPGNRFLKKKVNIKEPDPGEKISGTSIRGSSAGNKRRDAESEDEEILQLVGSSVEFSENDDKLWKMPKPPRTPSPASRLTPRRNLLRSPSAVGFFSPRRPTSRFSSRTPSPPSRATPRYPRKSHSLIRFGSRSPSPSVRSSLTSNSPRPRLGRRSRTPISQRSDLKSLDELFSRADDMSSASSNDFKLNIMSLDELAPAAGTEELEEKRNFSSLAKKAAKEKPKKIKQVPSTDLKEHSHKKDVKAFMRQKSSSDEESATEVQTETNHSEVSKHPYKDRSSFKHYYQEQPDETTVHSAYSEDFEDSVSSDNGPSSKSYSYSFSKSISSEGSSLSSSHSYPQPSQSKQKKLSNITHRVVVREASVQTNDAEFAYSWPQANIGFGPIAVEPASVVSHVVSPELLEALTTYSPMALALNDMLKQQLLLTKTFVDMARQLYFSTVKALESESYKYTTLEDTKKYIKQQKGLKWRQDHREEMNRTGDHKQ